MKIREANENDVLEIVNVLRASLGEDQLELSENVWRYKHEDNPFGKSIVLVAEEDQNIIGVRALMRWKWQLGKNQFSALRAVDTATHPNHQGKGVFKDLTLRAVEIAKRTGVHFIFNTPNDQSRPGYLKMGWEEVGKINVGIKPSFSFLGKYKTTIAYSIEKKINDAEITGLCEGWVNKLELKSGLFTPKSSKILSWRYENNPLQSYEVRSGEGYYLAAYIKTRGKLKELRIVEFIYEDRLDNKYLLGIIKNVERKFGCHFVSFSPNMLKMKGKKGNFGPILTFNPLHLEKENLQNFRTIQEWNNSLGDLELF